MSQIIYAVFLFFLSLNSLQANLSPSSNLNHFHICTVASLQSENLHKLFFSCQQHHIDLEIIGLDLPYYGNGTKLLRMAEYVNNLDDNDLVMFIDAFDVLVIADKEVILEKFLKMNTPFVMSAERNCFPFPNRANEYPPTLSSFKYINTGSYIGYVKNLKQWLTALQPFDLTQGDQGQVTSHYLDKKSLFVLDYSCKLFLPLFKVQPHEIEIDVILKVVRCLATNSEPCVIHANGRSFKLWNMIYQDLLAQ